MKTDIPQVPPSAVIRLQPMDETDFQAFVARAVPRRAAKWVERGIWSEAKALETCQQLYVRLLPEGRNTPGNHFVKIIDARSGTPLGEAWYTTDEQGGRLQFRVEWIQINLEHRRKGYATEVLRMLEEIARKFGADRVGLTVWMDNPDAHRLYTKLGYNAASVNMTKRLEPTP